MSIFRESFPQFIQDELNRRQTGMFTRTPQFLHQLNSRSSWVRMTSGVNYDDSNELAKKYVLQGGTLNDSTSLKYGLGEGGAYDRLSPGGTTNRMGIRPMPGITNISIQSKGAYGSLQEATVNFVAWDIRQLEELELLYMRPGYTVLLEFGWSYTQSIPRYDILTRSDLSLNDAFTDIYKLIETNNGNYDALLGYVKNYNWSARDDGGYDCSTTIISLGEVLESLKVNWVPMETKAFSKDGSGIMLFKEIYTPSVFEAVQKSYEQGIIPGLLSELWFLSTQSNRTSILDPNFKNTYNLVVDKNSEQLGQDDRNGYPKPLGSTSGKGRLDTKTEAWIALDSFCDLLNNYVLLKGINDNPLVQITSYESDASGNITKEPLKCIASPLSLSTNLAVCYVKNDNWLALGVKGIKKEAQEDSNNTGTIPAITITSQAIQAIRLGSLGRFSYNNTGLTENDVYNTFGGAFLRKFRRNGKLIEPDIGAALNDFGEFLGLSPVQNNYTYIGGQAEIEKDLEQLASQLRNTITNIKIENEKVVFILSNGQRFTSSILGTNINFFDYLYSDIKSLNEKLETAYDDLFSSYINDANQISGLNKEDLKNLIKKYLTRIPPDQRIISLYNQAAPEVVERISDQVEQASSQYIGQNIKEFIQPSDPNVKQIGYISNIYLNINFLYSQAVSRNVASTDNQNNNIISVRKYLQSILNEVQNSLGNINNFDIQVDNRNAIGRIIDINYTGDPKVNLFTLQLHNLNSVVRNYNFQSKIFPEMGSIIAISAQDATGVGKLGYDNATLVAWNEGIKDRLIPKKDFTSKIKLAEEDSTKTFLLPFLTKIEQYFKFINGTETKNNSNYAYGGLNFAFRDFLSNVDRYDPRNKFKTIIPTELSVTLDGIGGIVIGNLFKINDDIIPKGYKGISGNREVAYIVTKINHSLSDNDWVTELNAYPIILNKAEGRNLISAWDNNQYPRAVLIAGGVPIGPLTGQNVDGEITNPGEEYFSVPNLNYPNVTFGVGSLGDTTQDIPNTNASLLEDIQTAAKAAGVTVVITTIIGGHKTATNSGVPSRHNIGNAVDISIINGLAVRPEGQSKILTDNFVAQLVNLGYTKNQEQGQNKSVLTFGFPNHDDHIHISNRE